MLLLGDTTYYETKKLALGQSKPGPALVEFADWFMQTYAVQVLNIEFSKLTWSKVEKYRLYIIIPDHDGHEKMFKEHFRMQEDDDRIAEAFRQTAVSNQIAKKRQLQDIFVAYNDFSEEAKTEANWKATPLLEQFAKDKYPSVWRVLALFTTSVVFYYSATDMEANERSGLSAQIADEYFRLLKESDNLNYFTRGNFRLKFDSKENVDKNYEGSLFYYSR